MQQQRLREVRGDAPSLRFCNNSRRYYSDRHSVLHSDQPMAWTEDEQWFESWGKVYDPIPLPGQSVGNMNSYGFSVSICFCVMCCVFSHVGCSFIRLPAELADSIARWFAAGASHHVYYMWQGGNHLARWAGASVTNMRVSRRPSPTVF